MSTDSKVHDKSSAEQFVTQTPVLKSDTSISQDSSETKTYKEGIIVYILEGKDPSKAEHLVELFKDEAFTTYVIKVDPPQGVTKDEDIEKYTYEWCLKDAKNRDDEQFVLVIKDTTYSHLRSKDLSKAICGILHDVEDVVYLNRYQDQCEKFANELEFQFVRTYSPHGTHAILFSPKGRDLVLDGDYLKKHGYLSNVMNNAIASGRITGHCFHPNLIQIDPTTVANVSYLQECRNGSSSSSTMSFVMWMILILIVLAIIFFVFYRPTYKL